jgi:plasmid stabilization system protein ParE
LVRIEFAPEVFEDFDRIFDHLAEYDVPDIPGRIASIIAGLEVLKQHPLIGRPVEGGRRELVLGRGSRGYVALYRFEEMLEIAFILAIRSQREAGYARPAANDLD